MLSTAVQPLTKLSHPFLDSSTVHRSTYRRTYRLKQLRSKLIQVRSRQVPTKIPTHPIKIQTTTKLETCAQKLGSFMGHGCPQRWIIVETLVSLTPSLIVMGQWQQSKKTTNHKPQTIKQNNHVTCDFSNFDEPESTRFHGVCFTHV